MTKERTRRERLKESVWEMVWRMMLDDGCDEARSWKDQITRSTALELTVKVTSGESCEKAMAR